MSDNLIPLNKRTKAEQRRIVTKGGIASGEARRNKRMLKEIFETLLNEEITDKNGVKRTVKEAGAMNIVKQYISGNLKAFELVRDTIGEKPAETIITADITQKDIDEVQELINSAK